MNGFLKHLNKIEFVITYACTGSCKHCSEGDHEACGEHISPEIGDESVRRIVSAYPSVQTVMTFGGEPLLYPETVCAIHAAAREMGVPKRQVITNGYFSKDTARIRATAEALAACGVNDLLLSADAFHQETIPLETVRCFAEEIRRAGVPIRMQPAWLVSREHDNPYNRKTREILRVFSALGIEENDGNVIFPEGNARRYLSEYFSEAAPENPYREDPRDVKCVSFAPNGDVLDGNVYRSDIRRILEAYNGAWEDKV